MAGSLMLSLPFRSVGPSSEQWSLSQTVNA